MKLRATVFAAMFMCTGAQRAQAAEPPCKQATAACLKQIAQLYLDALLSHDGGKLPLAANVRRSENALTNAKGAEEVRESFLRTKMVKAVREVRLVADPASNEVVAFFVGDIDLDKADATATTKAGGTDYKVAVTVPEGTYTVHEAERFKIIGGFITEIEIIAHVENGKGMGSGWPTPRDAAVAR